MNGTKKRLPKILEIENEFDIDKNSFLYFDIQTWQVKSINLVWD